MQGRTSRYAVLVGLLAVALLVVPVHGSAPYASPVIASAQAFSDGTLSIAGSNFVVTPQPRVFLGTQTGGFQELPVVSASTSSIVARLGTRGSGTYRLYVLFGGTAPAVVYLDVTLFVPDAPLVPTADTILLWHLDEGEGTVAHDSSGNGRDGTVVGAKWKPGRWEMGLWFDGGPTATQYVTLADSDALTPPALTIDVWIKPSRLDINDQFVVHKYQNNVPSNSDYLIYLIDDLLIFGTRGWQSVSTKLPAVDTWYRVTAIADGANSKLYVNRELKDSGPLESIPNGTAPLVVGSCLYGCEINNRNFAGVIDELRISKGVVLP